MRALWGILEAVATVGGLLLVYEWLLGFNVANHADRDLFFFLLIFVGLVRQGQLRARVEQISEDNQRLISSALKQLPDTRDPQRDLFL